MKNLFYILFFLSLVFTASDFVGAVNFGLERVDPSLRSTNVTSVEGAVSGITNLVAYLVGFFYLIALILGIYAGFIIMTSGGEEERIKKGKNIFIYVLIGLIVVFLASTIIQFVIGAFQGPQANVGGSPIVPIQGGNSGGNGGFNFPQGSAPAVDYTYPTEAQTPGGALQR